MFAYCGKPLEFDRKITNISVLNGLSLADILRAVKKAGFTESDYNNICIEAREEYDEWDEYSTPQLFVFHDIKVPNPQYEEQLGNWEQYQAKIAELNNEILQKKNAYFVESQAKAEYKNNKRLERISTRILQLRRSEDPKDRILCGELELQYLELLGGQ